MSHEGEFVDVDLCFVELGGEGVERGSFFEVVEGADDEDAGFAGLRDDF